ncbi:cardioacceleratory peptide receptor-like [Haemaphysalis longicornis]
MDFKENNSSSSNDTQLEPFDFYQVETLTFLWILFACIVLGNSAVLAALPKGRKSRMNFFIMHLAIADLGVGLVSVLTDIIWKTTVDWYGGNLGCKFVKFAQVLVTYSSTYVLVALSIDRYDAITRPMNFSGSWKRARWLVTLAWAISVAMSLPSVYLNGEAVVHGRLQCWIELDLWQWQVYMTLVAGSLFFVPALLIAACYSVIVYTIWKRSKMLRGVHGKETETRRASSRGVIPKAKVKTVKMTLIIVLAFVLCWSPYFVYDLLQVYGGTPQTQAAVAVATFVQSLAPLNSVANPLIYCLFSSNVCRNVRQESLITTSRNEPPYL